ncbi:MAG: SGNH/GDSL hydrolase family protein [Rhodothermales bacterium]
MKRVKQGLTIATVSLVLLFALEGGVRLLAPQHVDARLLAGHPLAVEDTVLGHRNRAGAVVQQRGPEFTALYTINEHGFRDRAVDADERPPGRLRVVLLGDSFTFGIGSDYEEIWPTVFEHALQTGGYPVDVINAGVPGYDTRSEVLYLEHDWDALRPDVVVFTFMPNDLFTNTPVHAPDSTKEQQAVIVPMGEKAPVLHVLTLLQRWLLRHDGLYTWMYRRTARGPFFEDPPARHIQRQLETTAALLRRAQAFCRMRGVPFVVFSIPQQFQVLVEANGYVAGNVDVHTVDRVLSREAAETGFTYVAALDTLAAAYRRTDTDLYYRLDGHLTEPGNRLAGLHFAGRFEDVLTRQMDRDGTSPVEEN